MRISKSKRLLMKQALLDAKNITCPNKEEKKVLRNKRKGNTVIVGISQVRGDNPKKVISARRKRLGWTGLISVLPGPQGKSGPQEKITKELQLRRQQACSKGNYFSLNG